MRQRAVEGDGSGERGVAAEALDMGEIEEHADVEAGEIDFGVGGVVAGEGGLAVGGEVGGVHAGGQVVGDGAIGGVGLEFETAQRLTAQRQGGHGGVGVHAGVVEGAGSLEGEVQLAGGVQAVAAHGLDAGQFEVRAGGLNLAAAGLQVIRTGGGDFSAFAIHGD